MKSAELETKYFKLQNWCKRIKKCSIGRKILLLFRPMQEYTDFDENIVIRYKTAGGIRYVYKILKRR